VATRNAARVRKAAEQHLLQMEARYRGLLEAAPDAMVVVDQAGEIVLLNVQAEKQFGYQRDELVGQPVTNIIPKGIAEQGAGYINEPGVVKHGCSGIALRCPGFGASTRSQRPKAS
jgi:PAS domain-containing protein